MIHALNINTPTLEVLLLIWSRKNNKDTWNSFCRKTFSNIMLLRMFLLENRNEHECIKVKDPYNVHTCPDNQYHILKFSKVTMNKV